MKDNSDCWKNERTALIEARERLGLSRPQLAKEIGVVRSLINKVEMGTQGCGLATMIRWVEALGPTATLELFRGGQARQHRSRQPTPSKPSADSKPRRSRAAALT
jgi:DNA-binding XRE family transcriptional regulator